MMEPNGPPHGTEAEGSRGNVSIDRVLTALRAAEPAPGLEDRLLRRLATTTPSRRPAWLAWAAPATLAACAAAALLQFGIHTRRNATSSSFRPERNSFTVSRSGETRIPRASAQHEPEPGREQRASARSNSPAIDPGFSLGPSSTIASAAPKQNSPIVLRREETRISSSPVRSTITGRLSEGPGFSPANADVVRPAALAAEGNAQRGDTAQASYPAPELPLTEQERLLIRIAHQNDPVQIAALDPVARELELAHERAETRRFFTPPPRPPEIQHDIDEAMKSQTIITPATDRTVP